MRRGPLRLMHVFWSWRGHLGMCLACGRSRWNWRHWL